MNFERVFCGMRQHFGATVALRSSALRSVFFSSSMVTVIGPTPLGTGLRRAIFGARARYAQTVSAKFGRRRRFSSCHPVA